MKKKTTIFIRDGEVRNYQDPLRRLAPVEKISSTDNHRETLLLGAGFLVNELCTASG